jgi:diguanylate cyclase (GGDEF)-like protein
MEYERWRRMASSLTGTSAAYIEFNLITGAVERIEGEFVQNGEKNAEILLRDFEQTRVQPADRRKFHMFVSMERLRFMSKDSVLRDECTVHTIQPDGSVRECTISLRMTETDDGKDAKAIVAITDLGDSRRGMERLSELAFQDGLSGLLNRTAARAAIEETLRSGGNETVALFMLDIDNFKLVNDLMGHRQGDRALVQISDAMRGVFRTTDIVARIGGDEFFVFLTDVSLPGLVEAKASALCNALNFTYSNGIRSVAVSASIGIVVARRDQVDYEALYTEADLALYEAKNTGKNRYRIHYVTKKSELGAHSEVGTAYSVQIYSLLKYMDGGVALLEAGETTRLLFASGGGLHREDRPVWDEKDVHPEDKDALLSKMQACAADGTAFESAYRFLLTGGSYGWRHIRAEKIPSAEGSPVRLVSVITDITDLKRSSLGLKSIVASAPIGIAIVRFGERLETTFYNDALLSILGVTFDQYRLISHDFSALLLNNELAAVREAVARSMNHKEPLKTSFCALDEEGRHTRRVFVRGVLIDMLNGVPSYLLVMSEQNPSERGR